MKIKTIVMLLVLAAIQFNLFSCSNVSQESQEKESLLAENSITEDETECNLASSTSINDNMFFTDTETQVCFYEEIVKNNPIDMDYINDPEKNSKTDTINEMIEFKEKYIGIWITELDYSCDSFALLLNEEDKKFFEDSQREWVENLDEEIHFLNSVFVSGDYEVYPGKTYQLELTVKYLRQIRERTLYIKYLQYCMETNDMTPEDNTVIFNYSASSIKG